MREMLVIDSEEDESFWKKLDTGVQIIHSGLAEKGLKLISESTGLVFLNISPPDLDGMEALCMIKKEHPSMPVIIIACCQSEETCRCMEAFRKGAWDYIKKPLRAGEILHKIDILLGSAHISQSPPDATKSVPDEAYPDIPAHLVKGILKVRDFLSQNYSESLTLSAACKMATISKTYFCRFFKCITGRSLRSYQHYVKIQIAQELLQDRRLSITDVALKLGYDDSNYFSTIYKKITGSSPRCRKPAIGRLQRLTEMKKKPSGLQEL